MPLITLLSLAFCPSVSPVDFTERAMRLEALLPALGQACGENLRADTSVRDDVVFIRVHGVDPADLKQRIARVVEGEWRTQGDGEVLFRTPAVNAAQQRRDWETEAARSLKTMSTLPPPISGAAFGPPEAAALANRVKAALVNAVKNDQSYINTAKLTQGTPLANASQVVLTSIDPIAVAKLRGGEHAVFALNPNGHQRPFAASAATTLNVLRNQINLVIRSLQAVRVKDALGDEGVLQYSESGLSDLIQLASGRTGPVTGVYATITKNAYGSADARVILTDSVGRVIHESEGSYPVSPEESDGDDSDDAYPPARPFTGWSPDSRALIKWEEQAISEELAAKIAHPETYDPLCFFGQDVTLSQAPAGANIVANMSEDAMVTPFQNDSATDADISELFHDLYTATKDDNWWEVKITTPARDRLLRFDRKLWQPYFSGHGFMRLEDQMELAKRQSSESFEYAGFWGDEVGYETTSNLGDYSVLLILDALRMVRMDGGRIPFGMLPQPAQNLIAQYLYFGKGDLEIDSEDESEGDSEFTTEPSILLPAGIAGTSQVMMSSATMPDFFPFRKLANHVSAQGPIDADEIGRMEVLPGEGGDDFDLNRFQAGVTRDFDLTLMVTPKLAMQMSLRVSYPDGPVINREALPAAFRAAIEEARQEYQRRKAERRSGGEP